MIDPRFIDVVGCICSHLSGTETTWAVTGSLGQALQGVEVAVHDIDIQTDEPGAYEIERCFSDHVVRKVQFSSTETIRSHFGELCIDGVSVEIMGAIQKRLPDGKWEDRVDVSEHRRFVDLDGLAVPVLSLEYECQAYRRLGRTAKADMLQEWLDEHANHDPRRPT